MDTKEMEVEFKDLTALVEADAAKDEKQVYELGYHLLPTIVEDELEVETTKVLKVLEEVKAEVIGERAPLKIGLAYSIEKKIDGTKRHFNEAYFGWIAFEVEGSALAKIDTALKANEQVLRYLLVVTNRDAVAATLADPSLDAAMVREEVGEEAVDSEEGEVAAESAGADEEAVEAE